MTMAAAIEDRTADAGTWSKASRIAGIDIVHDLTAAEGIWRKLEGAQTSFTPYQRFDFLNPWRRAVGERDGLVPFIVVAHDAERRPLLLLPLALRHAYGARCASFMGGKHSTFNMALFERALQMLAPFARDEKPPPVNSGPSPTSDEDPRLKRLEAQIDALTRQLEALGRDRQQS